MYKCENCQKYFRRWRMARWTEIRCFPDSNPYKVKIFKAMCKRCMKTQIGFQTADYICNLKTLPESVAIEKNEPIVK